jgi:hypothetical protein
MDNKVVNPDLSQQVFMNKNLQDESPLASGGLVLQVFEIETLGATLCS